MDNDDTLAGRLSLARRAQQMSTRELARRCGVSQATVAGWESGKYNPSADHLSVLAGALGSSVDWLIGRESQEPTAVTLLLAWMKEIEPREQQ